MSEERDTLALVEELAARAGRILLDRYRPRSRVSIVARKRDQPRNLVTEADTASEEVLLSELRTAFPDDTIRSEEAGASERESERVWYVDPLDGTVNFTHGHPFFCVSIGLVVAGKPVLGVIHAPLLSETFSGVVGEGAFLNGGAIGVSTSESLIESLVATGFAYDRNETPDDNVGNFARIVLRVRGVRRCGSAALDLAFVAAGRLDGFWELGLSPWDVAAGAAVVRAAGGSVTDFRGGDDFVSGRSIVATNGRIHGALRGLLSPLPGEKT